MDERIGGGENTTSKIEKEIKEKAIKNHNLCDCNIFVKKS